MLPRSFVPNITNSVFRNTQSSGDIALLSPLIESGSNVQHHGLSENRGVLPAASARPTLNLHVSKIVGLCSEEEMRRIAACSIVAFVTDADSLWNISEGQQPCAAMRAHRALVNSRVTIPGIAEAGNPGPAFIGRSPVNKSPKFGRVNISVRSFLFRHNQGLLGNLVVNSSEK